jgi:hypothetical protein
VTRDHRAARLLERRMAQVAAHASGVGHVELPAVDVELL